MKNSKNLTWTLVASALILISTTRIANSYANKPIATIYLGIPSNWDPHGLAISYSNAYNLEPDKAPIKYMYGKSGDKIFTFQRTTSDCEYISDITEHYCTISGKSFGFTINIKGHIVPSGFKGSCEIPPCRDLSDVQFNVPITCNILAIHTFNKYGGTKDIYTSSCYGVVVQSVAPGTCALWQAISQPHDNGLAINVTVPSPQCIPKK